MFQEDHGLAQRVGVIWQSSMGQLFPAERTRFVQPTVAYAQLVEQPHDPGGRVQARLVGPLRPVGRSRVRLDHREGERNCALVPDVRGHLGQVVARPADQRRVVGLRGHQGLQRDLDVDGEAGRAALVGL